MHACWSVSLPPSILFLYPSNHLSNALILPCIVSSYTWAELYVVLLTVQLLIDSLSPNELAPQGRVTSQPGAIISTVLKAAKSENKTMTPNATDITLTEIFFHELPITGLSWFLVF